MTGTTNPSLYSTRCGRGLCCLLIQSITLLGRAAPSGVNPSGETGTQTQEQPGAARNSGSTNRGLDGEPEVRMVPLPLRMVAVPVLARIPVRGDSGGVAPPASEPSRGRSQPNSDHVMQGQNVDSRSEPLVFASGEIL